jgi:hypothetical protein
LRGVAWSEFIFYQSIHLVTEFTPLLLYSEFYIALENRMWNALCLPRFAITDAYRYRLRTIRMLALKEWIRVYSILAVALLVCIAHFFVNRVYYPAFEYIDYGRFVGYMAASFASEFGSAVMVARLFRHLHKVQVWRSVVLLLEGQERFLFVLCVMMTAHVTNDPFISLLHLRL